MGEYQRERELCVAIVTASYHEDGDAIVAKLVNDAIQEGANISLALCWLAGWMSGVVHRLHDDGYIDGPSWLQSLGAANMEVS